MTDIFQLFASSANAAPGKGAGETLVSSPTIYKELRAIPHWRRTLAQYKGSGVENPELLRILPLTQSAQLWYQPSRTKRERATDLEEMRSLLEVKQIPNEPTEMADAAAAPSAPTPAPKKTKAKSKKTTNTVVPEGTVTNGNAAPAPLPEVVAPNMDTPEKKDSAIRFCPICRYYLYLQVEGEDQTLLRLCRNCGYKEEDEKGGLVMEMTIQEQTEEGYKILLNEFTRQDPRLPHIRKTIKCPDPACKSNHGETESDVIYIKYDSVNMLYMYICDVCGYQWRSGR